MVSELSITIKVESTVVSGSKIKCRAEGHSIMIIINLLMKVNGAKINFMDLEFFTMKTLHTQQWPLTPLIWQVLETVGSNMRVISGEIRKADKVLFSYQMVPISVVSSKTIYPTEKEHSIFPKAIFGRGSGKMVSY